jgi:hypothetical protein
LFAAQGTLFWRTSVRSRPIVLAVVAAVMALTLLQAIYSPLRYWYPDVQETAREADNGPRFRLTQDVVETQGERLKGDLDALAPRRAGRVNMYVVTYAPYANDDVFSRESALVASVMRDRFDAGSHTIELVSRFDQSPHTAWATPLNLQRAIARVAALMNRDEDVLFVYLTSHGARNGSLAASMWPLEVDALTPQQLNRMLDEAKVRNRVVAVSACYSGSWLIPLSGGDTLVMTAADATHTSYGCGRGSELTYFGHAMFDEQLRRTRSFEEAHAAARATIEQREKDAKKSDGYSNPQIAVGAGIRETLSRLASQLTQDSVGKAAGRDRQDLAPMASRNTHP